MIFGRCKEFYEDEIDEESKKLNRLNTSLTKLAIEQIDEEILEPLRLMVKDAQKNVDELKGISKKLKGLQDEFFTEIKFIADQVGIAMPEPSEIDLIKDKVRDPLEMLEEYKKENGIKTDESLVYMLEEMFEDVEPVIDMQMGGSEYQNQLTDILEQIFDIKDEDIRIHDVYKNTKEYMELMKGI